MSKWNICFLPSMYNTPLGTKGDAKKSVSLQDHNNLMEKQGVSMKNYNTLYEEYR